MRACLRPQSAAVAVAVVATAAALLLHQEALLPGARQPEVADLDLVAAGVPVVALPRLGAADDIEGDGDVFSTTIQPPCGSTENTDALQF